jgi:AraC-like DNA-binding protein
LAKLALDLDHALARRREAGTPGRTAPRALAAGDGWSVSDVVCTCGPRDRPYEERHDGYSISLVVAGSFEYRCPAGRAVMTAGSLMLGTNGHGFECAHRHGEGDRCVAFFYDADHFERLAMDAGASARGPRFPVARLPQVREMSSLVARITAAVGGTEDAAWDEFAVSLATRTIAVAAGLPPDARALPPNALAKVTRVARAIERHPDAVFSLDRLASGVGLSPYHFLRTFRHATGVTPHQFVLRARLRDAAERLSGPGRVLDIALDSGFDDVSNFNRAFRTEFGMAPLAFRRHSRAQ